MFPFTIVMSFAAANQNVAEYSSFASLPVRLKYKFAWMSNSEIAYQLVLFALTVLNS